jgi:hypothetical protein
MGVDSFQALASRALSLAKSRAPGLRAVQITAQGGLLGLGDLPFNMTAEDGGEVGVILIAQLLGLFLDLLGEAATLRLVEHMPPSNGGQGDVGQDLHDRPRYGYKLLRAV